MTDRGFLRTWPNYDDVRTAALDTIRRFDPMVVVVVVVVVALKFAPR